MTTTLSQSSRARVKAFVDDFIRSEYVQSWTESSVSSDYGLHGRFSRCMDAAEDGCDGSTHAEVINDWRGAFHAWLRERKNHPSRNDVERFEFAVLNHFDGVWDWHIKNGSIDQQIG